jgi:hypothetical protein
MRLQDYFHYDSAIWGLNNIYIPIRDSSLYINVPFILTTNKIVTNGKQYILVFHSPEEGIKNYNVEFVDGYFKDSIIHLFVQDVITNRIFTIDQYILYTKSQCSWVLYDMEHYDKKCDNKSVTTYCEKCNDKKKRPVVDSNLKKLNDDLLDFEF